MPENVSPSEVTRRDYRKFGKYKWREKLFSADGILGRGAEALESKDDDIANFLHAAVTRSEASPQPAALAPQGDAATGSRWPSDTQSTQTNRVVDTYRRPKPRQNKGLHVTFASAKADIIGEGGDQAELPSIEISRAYSSYVGSEDSEGCERKSYDLIDQSTKNHGISSFPENDLSSYAPSLQRRPTGLSDLSFEDDTYHLGDENQETETNPSLSSLGTEEDSQQLRNPDKVPNETSPAREHAQGKTHIDSEKPTLSEDFFGYDHNYGDNTKKGRSDSGSSLRIRSSESIPGESLTPGLSPPDDSVSQAATLLDDLPHIAPLAKSPPRPPGSEYYGPCSQTLSSSANDKSYSLPSVAKSLGDDSLDDFDSRVRRFNDLFRLSVSAHTDLMSVPFAQWTMASAWWFMKGRAELEDSVRGKSITDPTPVMNDRDLPMMLIQAYVDLAKSWWIMRDITPNHPELKRFGNTNIGSLVAIIKNFGNEWLAELVEVHLNLMANMRSLTMSMKRNGRLPQHDLQIQRLDLHVLLELPALPSRNASLLINNTKESHFKSKLHVARPFFPILMGDTERHFSFGRMFAAGSVSLHHDAKEEIHLPCIVSVLRERSDWAVKAVIASQDGQVNLVIQSGEENVLNWHDVRWNIQVHTMQIKLTADIEFHVKFSEKDFKTIWGICDYTQRIRKEYSAGKREELLLERRLRSLQCFDTETFPYGPINDCSLRIFEKTTTAVEATGQRRIHDGYRLMAITPPGMKTMSNINHQLGKGSLIFFGYRRRKSNNVLTLRVPSLMRISLNFRDIEDVDILRSILSGTSITEEEYCSAVLPLQSLTITPMAPDIQSARLNANRPINDLRWYQLFVANQRPPLYGHDSPPTVFSEHLRILTDCDFGTFTDRINVGPGELQIQLNVEDPNEIKLLRPAQQDMTWCFADNRLPEVDVNSLSSMLQMYSTSPTVRTYKFRSLSDLHIFQSLVTGFTVLYDGIASTFGISRRRMVVPIYKRWETSCPRLQLLRQDKTVQLTAFFRDFTHGACMNFVLKVTDVFETSIHSGAFSLRIVDAKFALPKNESEFSREFVCLDMPEYPAEHDDITVGFDNENGKSLHRLNNLFVTTQC